jgi:hypothetical protein
MTEFATQLIARVEEAAASLAQARRDGDDYLEEIRLGELESLAHLARSHGVTLPEAAARELPLAS